MRRMECVTLSLGFLLFCCNFEKFLQLLFVVDSGSSSKEFKQCRLLLFVERSCRDFEGIMLIKGKKRAILPPNGLWRVFGSQDMIDQIVFG